MSTPRARDRRSLRNSDLQRLPSHTRYPLTPSRLVTTTTPSGQRSASRFTPRARASAAPSTPYGLRARQQRAANTPGRDRRRSGRIQRETTFDILRNLGKALAPVSRPIQSSPQDAPQPAENDPIDEFEELDNEPENTPPRLSLPIQGSEEGSDDPTPPPRMSAAFDDDITYRSVEYPMRETSIKDQQRLSMYSQAGRLSENFRGHLDSDSDAGEQTGLFGGDEAADNTIFSGGDFDQGGETENLDRFVFDIPSPDAGAFEDPMDEQVGEAEGFELTTGDIQPLPGTPPSDNDDDVAGGFGFGLDLAPLASPSQSPGIVGGGLRDEGAPVQTKQKKLSRHGIPVPNMPAGVVKKLATRFAHTKGGSKAKINKAAMAAIEQASSWYFEQVSQDLAAYSKHAGRKTIDESDVSTLMRRQRHINSTTTMFSLAQKHLPKELQQDMRLAMPP
ncbi:uncharacterized protein N7477_006603 [Penicillium maclennaniae]|uniref:uncharacterized protein n=1 Tax=Penicillium maclennaniae TaxID=1343394 RepID=UPI002540D15B|nr:uncharacterized protein N7477_006603 [Penicillium maclennaniae]KAJ5668033.1 hypothetical protein N7477_006603 [Penicillium maclennaniae]